MTSDVQPVDKGASFPGMTYLKLENVLNAIKLLLEPVHVCPSAIDLSSYSLKGRNSVETAP